MSETQLQVLSPAAPAAPQPRTPPLAAQRPVTITLHGEVRTDEFAWMRHRDDPAVLEYLRAENAYTEAMTAHTEALRETLYAEILGRIKETDEQVPVKDGAWTYYSRTEEGKAYPIHCRRAVTPDAPEAVILDENVEAQGHAFYDLGGFEVSPDGRYLAVLVDTTGYEDFVLQVRDLSTGQWLPDRVERLSWGLAWASDAATVFYVRGDDAKRPHEVWRHTLGTPESSDARVFREDDVTFNVSVGRSRSGAWVFVHAHSYTQDEWYVIDAADPTAVPRVIVPRTAGLEYTVDHGGDWLYVVTNRDGATNFQVMRAPVQDPARWEPYTPPRADVFVEGVDVFRDWLVRTERRDGLRRLLVTELASGAEHEIGFDDAAYGVSLNENPEFATDALRFTYSSLVTPSSVYDYDLRTRQRVLRKQQEVLGGYDPSRYAVERLTVPARDGTPVPVSLLTRRDTPRDGSAPLLLYAYGSYGATMEPTFSSARCSLVDRGVGFAIAHVRGGQEMGRPWYDAGKMLAKWNTFTDFLDVADALVAAGYTAPDRLVAHGGSAGGLLMGVIANERPQLFRAIVADVPFVDVVNTMLDASIPLTAQEWEQWGNPQDEQAYRYIRSYSPYDNVRAQAYPWMLVMSGINDSRVAYWEPTKWVARLRARKTDENPLLLQMQLEAGHGGASGRYDRIKETAFRFAFVLDAVGLGGGGSLR
jgi:oligopeptidase B